MGVTKLTRPVIDSRNQQYSNYKNPNKSYNTAPIIDGYFPKCKTYKEMAVTRVNRTLCSILILFILISAVSYYFVTANEITLNKYRKQTLSLNDENVELQNKLDYLKSYYNVDKAMQQKNLLHKAKNVMEVKETASSAASVSKVKTIAQASDKPFQWSIGY